MRAITSTLSTLTMVTVALAPALPAQAAARTPSATPSVAISTSSPATEHVGDVVTFTLTGHGWPAGARLALAQRVGTSWFVVTHSVASNRTSAVTVTLAAGAPRYRAVVFRDGHVLASSTAVAFKVG